MRRGTRDVRWGLLVVTLVATGCGGGSTGTGTDAPTATPGSLSAGAHTLSLSVAMAPEVQVPVSGVSVAFVLPQGLTVATSESGAGRIVDSALVAGEAVVGQHLVSGSFSPSTRVVRVSMATVPSAAWSGEFARLTVTVPPGSTVRAADVEGLGARLQGQKVVGVDTTRRTTVAVTDQARVSFRIVEH